MNEKPNILNNNPGDDTHSLSSIINEKDPHQSKSVRNSGNQEKQDTMNLQKEKYRSLEGKENQTGTRRPSAKLEARTQQSKTFSYERNFIPKPPIKIFKVILRYIRTIQFYLPCNLF